MQVSPWMLCCLRCTQVLTGGTIDEFAILAMLLAGINSIPPLLFLVYLFSNGKVLHAAVWVGQLLNGALFIGEWDLVTKAPQTCREPVCKHRDISQWLPAVAAQTACRNLHHGMLH